MATQQDVLDQWATQSVTNLYEQILGRAPDAAGLEFYKNIAKNEGLGSVQNALVFSQENAPREAERIQARQAEQEAIRAAAEARAAERVAARNAEIQAQVQAIRDRVAADQAAIAAGRVPPSAGGQAVTAPAIPANLQYISDGLYSKFLGRPGSIEELQNYANAFGPTLEPEEIRAFIEGAVNSKEITQEKAQGLLRQEKLIGAGSSTGPVDKINNKTVDRLAEQLQAQYNAIKENAGYTYAKEENLDDIFRAQAAKLAVNGINDLSDVGEKDGMLINKVTGDAIKKVELQGTNWKNDGSSAFKMTEDIQIEDRGAFQRWGRDLSTPGQADYGISFVDGQAVMVPIWKDTKTDVGPLAMLASVALNFAFPGAGAAIGSALAPTASAAVQAAVGGAVMAGVTTGVITGDLDKALIAAALAGGGNYLQASGSLGEAFDSLGLTEFKDTFGISGGVQTTAQAAAEDALQLAAQGLSEGQISDILQQNYGLSASQALDIGKNAFDVAFAAQDAQSLFSITNDANAVAQNLVAAGVDPNLAEALATSAGMLGGGADLSSIIQDSNLTNLVATNSSEGLFTATDEDLAKYGITTGGEGITLTADQLTKITSGEVAGDTFADQVLNAGGTIGGAATAGGLLDGAVDKAKELVGGLTGDGGTGFDLGGLLTNLAGAGIDYAALKQIGKEATSLGKQVEQRAKAAGAAANVPFTPYTVTTGAGSTAFGVDPLTGAPTAKVTPSAEYEALRKQALDTAGTTLGAIDPANAAQSLFNRAEALAGPARQRETEQLLSSLGARGLLGVSRNLPTVGGTVAGVNPYMESLLSAQRTAQAQTALQAEQFGTQEAQRQAALANALIGTGQNIDTAALGTLTQGANLGSLATSAAQTSAGRQLQATLAGQALRQQYENLGLQSQAQGYLGLAGAGRGLLGLPTQPGNTPSQNLISGLFDYIF